MLWSETVPNALWSGKDREGGEVNFKDNAVPNRQA